MGYATLKYPSQVGNARGTRGVRAFEVFTVYCDFPTDNPHRFIERGPILSDPWGRAQIAPLSRHPHPDFFDTELTEVYTLDEIAPQVFDVLLTYEKPDVGGGSFNGWILECTWSTRTEQLARGVGVFNSDGRTIDYTQPGELIGPILFNLVEKAEEASHQVRSPRDPDTTLYLRASGERVIEGAEGVRVIKPYRLVEHFERIGVEMAMQFSREIKNVDFAKLRFLNERAARVNKVAWNGFAPRRLLFVPLSLREEPTQDQHGRSTVHYPFSMVLLDRPKRWTPYEAIEVYTDPETQAKLEVTAKNSSVPTKSKWPVYEEVDFADLFNAIATGKITNPGGSGNVIPIGP